MKISILGLALILLTQSAWAEVSPKVMNDKACAPVLDACTKAGFVPGGGKDGIGIFTHCVQPIVQGTKQAKEAKKPLPKVAKDALKKCQAAAKAIH